MSCSDFSGHFLGEREDDKSPATLLSPIQTLDMEQPPRLRDGSGRVEAPWHRGLRGPQLNAWLHEAEVPAHGAGPSLMLMVFVSRFPSPRGTRKVGDFQLWH